MMKYFTLGLTTGLAGFAVMSTSAFAQDLPPPEALPIPQPPAASPGPSVDVNPDADSHDFKGPDYSKLSPSAERTAKLNEMFGRLSVAPDADSANLIAEEIWAVWLDSGSPSVNLVLRRGSDAQKKGKIKKARRLYDSVTTLSPDYAEGWARSARLALDEKDFSRSLTEAAQALVLEPRHFYALWTMGNVFEQLGRTEEALEAYREAHKLYPELKAVRDRKEALEQQLDGAVL